MKILALDLSKYKTVACDYEAETAAHSFATVATTAKGLHDLIVDREPDRSCSARFDFSGAGFSFRETHPSKAKARCQLATAISSFVPEPSHVIRILE